MRVFLDDKPLSGAGPSLASAIRAAGNEADRAGRVVIEVKLDGKPITDESLDRPSDAPMPEGSEVRFITTDPRALARTSLLDASELLGGVRSVQRGASSRRRWAGSRRPWRPGTRCGRWWTGLRSCCAWTSGA